MIYTHACTSAHIQPVPAWHPWQQEPSVKAPIMSRNTAGASTLVVTLVLPIALCVPISQMGKLRPNKQPCPKTAQLSRAFSPASLSALLTHSAVFPSRTEAQRSSGELSCLREVKDSLFATQCEGMRKAETESTMPGRRARVLPPTPPRTPRCVALSHKFLHAFCPKASVSNIRTQNTEAPGTV